MVFVDNFRAAGGAGDLLSRLGLENGKLADAISKVSTEVKDVLSNLTTMLNAASGGFQGASGQLERSQLAMKLAFVAILEDAQRKAMASKSFNPATAALDLAVRLDALGGVATPAPAGDGAAKHADLYKLQQLVVDHAQLFDALSEVAKAQDGAARNIVRNTR
ncbi:MAG: hypothetical protein IPK81_24575 [Rhodospirillales bacterium]|nr:hypothetical protein [Rhodospirillales bacterium]QQS12595.1 MAG: hypothetical protein IPK81_24575 [Rhodospirillales bacterium]